MRDWSGNITLNYPNDHGDEGPLGNITPISKTVTCAFRVV